MSNDIYAQQQADSLEKLVSVFVTGRTPIFGGRKSGGLGGSSSLSGARSTASGSSGTRRKGVTEKKLEKLQQRLLKADALKLVATEGYLKEILKAAKTTKIKAQETERISKITRENITAAKELVKNTRDVTQLTQMQKRGLEKLGIKYEETLRHTDDMIDAGDKVRRGMVEQAKLIDAQNKQYNRSSTSNSDIPGGSGGSVGSGTGGGKFSGPSWITNTITDLMPAAMSSAQVLRAGASLGIDTLKSEARTGVGLSASEMGEAAAYGMNPKEFMEMVAEYRTTANGLRMTTAEMGKSLKSASFDLLTTTGDFAEGMRVQGDIMQQFKSLGGMDLKSDGFKSYETAQIESFKVLHKSINMTSDEFRTLTKDLTSSESARGAMFKMDKQQRFAYAANLTQQYARLKLYDVEHEAATKMIDAMTTMGSKGPKDRLKEAAKAQALMGAIGMGDQAARYSELVIKGHNRTASDNNEFLDMNNRIADQTSVSMGGGFVGEMTTSALLEKTGMDQYFGPNGSFAELAMRQIQGAELNNKAQMELQTTLLNGSNERLSTMNKTMEKGFQALLSATAAKETALGNVLLGVAGTAGAAAVSAAGAAKYMASRLGGGASNSPISDGTSPSPNGANPSSDSSSSNGRKGALKGVVGGVVAAVGLGAAAYSQMAGSASTPTSKGPSKMDLGLQAVQENSMINNPLALLSMIGPQSPAAAAVLAASAGESFFTAAYPEQSEKTSNFIGSNLTKFFSVFSEEAKQRQSNMAAVEADKKARDEKIIDLLQNQNVSISEISGFSADTAQETKGLRLESKQASAASLEAAIETTEAIEKPQRKNFNKGWRSQHSPR